MIIKALLQDEKLDFASRLGTECPQGEEVFVEDRVYENPIFANLVEVGRFEVVSFSSKPTSEVVQQEFSQYSAGMYQAALSSESLGIAHQAAITNAILTIPDGNFDLGGNNKELMLLIDKLHAVKIVINQRFHNTGSLLAALQASAELAVHADVALNGSDIEISSKSGGSNASVEVISDNTRSDASQEIGIEDAASPEILDTFERAEVIKLTLKSPADGAVNKGKVILTLWDSAVGGSQITTCQWQRQTKGESDVLYTEELVAYSNANGEIEVELLCPTVGATVHVQAAAPAGYWLADLPTSRLAVTTAAGV